MALDQMNEKGGKPRGNKAWFLVMMLSFLLCLVIYAAPMVITLICVENGVVVPKYGVMLMMYWTIAAFLLSLAAAHILKFKPTQHRQ